MRFGIVIGGVYEPRKLVGLKTDLISKTRTWDSVMRQMRTRGMEESMKSSD